MKKKRILIISFLFLLIGSIFWRPFFHKPNIKTVLKSDAYAYLSNEVKKYIEEVYEETGEIVLTENNKEENVPYLNPQYIEYLSLSDEEKEQVEEIPVPYVIQFSVDKANGNYPTSYDLRNVGGKNYVTPLKDQKSLDLCWDFTTIAQAESYLLLKSGQGYSSSFPLYSTRQLDYATSSNGFNEYTCY